MKIISPTPPPSTPTPSLRLFVATEFSVFGFNVYLRFCFVYADDESMVTFTEAEHPPAITAVAILPGTRVVYIAYELQLQYSPAPDHLKIKDMLSIRIGLDTR